MEWRLPDCLWQHGIIKIYDNSLVATTIQKNLWWFFLYILLLSRITTLRNHFFLEIETLDKQLEEVESELKQALEGMYLLIYLHIFKTHLK